MKKIAAIALVSGLVFFAAASVRAGEAQPGAEPQKRDSVVLKWLGTVGWEIRLGKTVVLIDPFLTRIEAAAGSEWKTNEEAALKVIERTDIIFAGHSHADHFADIPFISLPNVLAPRWSGRGPRPIWH